MTSNKKVTFAVKQSCEDNGENETKMRTSEKLHKVPAFCTQRLFKSMANNSSTPSMVIKDQHAPKLERMSTSELHELLNKQQKLLNNKIFLSKLKDKGEKIMAFQDKIKDQLKLRETIATTVNKLENLTINDPDTKCESATKDVYINKKKHVLKKSKQEVNLRFNMPKINVSKLNQNEKLETNISPLQEIKTLEFDESLKTLELSCSKERNVFKDQLIRFYAYRTQEDDEDDEGESSMSEYEDSDY